MRRWPRSAGGARPGIRLGTRAASALLAGAAAAGALVGCGHPVDAGPEAPDGTCAQNCDPAARTTHEEDGPVIGYGNGEGNGNGNGNGQGNGYGNGQGNGHGNVIVNGNVVAPEEWLEPLLDAVRRLVDPLRSDHG